jgi:hypothetical protein
MPLKLDLHQTIQNNNTNVFNAPFTLFSKMFGSFRNASHKLNVKMCYFLKAETLDITNLYQMLVCVKRLLSHLDMLDLKILLRNQNQQPFILKKRRGYERNVLGCYMIMDASDVMSKRCSLATITIPLSV